MKWITTRPAVVCSDLVENIKAPPEFVEILTSWLFAAGGAGAAAAAAVEDELVGLADAAGAAAEALEWLAEPPDPPHAATPMASPNAAHTAVGRLNTRIPFDQMLRWLRRHIDEDAALSRILPSASPRTYAGRGSSQADANLN